MAEKKITLAEVQHTPALVGLLNTMQTDIDSLITLANELRTDHATQKTSHDAMETAVEELMDDHATNKTTIDESRTAIIELIDDHATNKTTMDESRTAIMELIDDHATFKTAVDETKTAVDELIDDHATNKTTIDESRTAIIELIDDHATFKTAVDETETLIEEMYDDEEAKRNYLDFLGEPDGVIGGSFTIAAGAAVTLTGAGFVSYRIGGQLFYSDLDTTITLADDGDVDDTKWRAWRIEIDRAGTVTATADGDTQHANEEDALLNLASVARTSNTATIGYFTIHSNGGFNIGTDNVNGETAANVYHVRGPAKQVSGLHTALGASIAVGSSDTNFSHGTVDCKINGLYKTQIAAGADVTFDDADTITLTGQYGGHLLLVGLDGASIYALAADGNAGAASAMTYADAAAANTAIDTLTDRLPEMFCPIGRITVVAAKDAFTYGTDDIAGTDGTATYTDATVGTWARASATGFDSHKVNPPTIPAVLTASKPSSAPATLTAGDPTASAATLTASKPTAGPATLTAGDPTASAATLSATDPTASAATLTASKPASGPATITAAAVTAHVDQGK